MQLSTKKIFLKKQFWHKISIKIFLLIYIFFIREKYIFLIAIFFLMKSNKIPELNKFET